MSGDERGQVAPLLLIVLLAALMLLAVLGRLGAVAVERAQAQAAADAAALGGVVDGRAAAEELARRNGARLVSFDGEEDGDVLVVVELGGASAEARAALRDG